MERRMRYCYQLIIDPEFESLVPPLSQEEYSQLEANILRDGCRDPITIWDNKKSKYALPMSRLYRKNPANYEPADEAEAQGQEQTEAQESVDDLLSLGVKDLLDTDDEPDDAFEDYDESLDADGEDDGDDDLDDEDE